MKLSETIRGYAKKSITLYHCQALFETWAAEVTTLENAAAAGQAALNQQWDNTISRPPNLADLEAVRQQFKKMAEGQTVIHLKQQVRITAPIETWIARCDVLINALVDIRDLTFDIDDATRKAAEALEKSVEARPPEDDKSNVRVPKLWHSIAEACLWPNGTAFMFRSPLSLNPNDEFRGKFIYGCPRIIRDRIETDDFPCDHEFARMKDIEALADDLVKYRMKARIYGEKAAGYRDMLVKAGIVAEDFRVEATNHSLLVKAEEEIARLKARIEKLELDAIGHFQPREDRE